MNIFISQLVGCFFWQILMDQTALWIKYTSNQTNDSFLTMCVYMFQESKWRRWCVLSIRYHAHCMVNLTGSWMMVTSRLGAIYLCSPRVDRSTTSRLPSLCPFKTWLRTRLVWWWALRSSVRTPWWSSWTNLETLASQPDISVVECLDTKQSGAANHRPRPVYFNVPITEWIIWKLWSQCSSICHLGSKQII